MVFAGAEKKLRWVPRSLLLKRLGLPKSARRAYLAANADITGLGNARVGGRLLTDRMFRTALLKVVADRGDAPTWLYRFSWPSGHFGFAEHCLDVPFFFDCLDGPVMEPLAGPNPPQELADEVHGAAVAFITTGDPGWPRHHGVAGIARVYDVPTRDVADAYASVRPLLG
jgi:para-nitrobenzyl esterase